MKIKTVLALSLALTFCWQSTAHAGEYSKTLTRMGPWTIKRYSDDEVAHSVGSPCAAVQYANGADLLVTADPDHPEDKGTVQVFIASGKPYNDARIWIDDGMAFDHYLQAYWPQRHGHSGVFHVASLVGSKLFARFEIGHLDAGRFEFPIGNIKAVSAFLHQKKCVFEDDLSAHPGATKRQVDSISVGDSYDSVVKRLGAPETSYEFLEDNTEGFEWPLGKSGSVIVVFDQQRKVTQKVIKPKK